MNGAWTVLLPLVALFARGSWTRGSDELDERIRAVALADPASRERMLDELAPDAASVAERVLVAFPSLDVSLRRARAEILAQLAPPTAIDGVLEILGDPDQRVRVLLVRFLGRTSLGSEAEEARLEACRRAALDDPDASVRLEAIAMLGSCALPGSVDVLDSLLDACSGEEARAVARAFVGLPEARARLVARVRRLFEAARDEELEPEAAALLLEGYGKALADLPGGGRDVRERTPLILGRSHVSALMAAAARSALARFVARLAELGEYARADEILARLAAEGLPPEEILERRVRIAFDGGAAARALELARELERAADLSSEEGARSWLFRALHFQGAALFARGEFDAAFERFDVAERLLDVLVRERPDRLERLALRRDEEERSPGGGLLSADWILFAGVEKTWKALALVARTDNPEDPAFLELLRAAHEDTLRARTLAISADLESTFSLDALLDRDLAPGALVLLNRRLEGRDEDRAYALLEILGRGLATVAPWEMPGFEPFPAADAELTDPLMDPRRFTWLVRMREELLHYFERRIQRNQREAGRFLDVALPVNQRFKMQRDAIQYRMREEAEKLQALGGRTDLSAAERREIFHDLASQLTPSLGYGLVLVQNLSTDGRLEQAERLARKMLVDLASRLPGVGDVQSEFYASKIEQALGFVLSQAGRSEEAEEVYSSSLRRLEALENTWADSEDGLVMLRRERANILVSLAVNANVRLGDPKRALGFFEQAFELDQRDFMQVLLACYRARSGHAAEARAALRRITPEPQLYYNLSCTYALLGERELALDYLRRDLEQNLVSSGALEARKDWARGDPDLASLRDDARFVSLVAKKPD